MRAAGSTLIFDALKAGNKTPVDFASVDNTRTLDDPLCEPAMKGVA